MRIQFITKFRSFFTFIFAGLIIAPTPLFALTIPNDPNFSFLTPIYNQIGVLHAWDRTIGSPSVVVAVLDSGVDINHPDLKDNIWTNTEERQNGLDDDHNGYVDDVSGWDFVSNDSGAGPDIVLDPATGNYDEIGISHGTIVAGLIGAVGNNSRDISGVAMRVKIMPLKIAENHGRGAADDHGEGDEQNVIKAIDYAIAKHVDVINISLSGTEASNDLKEALRRASAANIVVVVAAGNDREKGNGDLDFSPKFPVCIDKGDAQDLVIGVAAVDENDVLTKYSNYGSCVDIVAPGSKIASTVYFDPNQKEFDREVDGYFEGTSLAAPLVSGTAALLKAEHPDWSADDIRAALYLSADNIDLKNPSLHGKLGHGRLNADTATRLKIVTTPAPEATVPVVEQKAGTVIVSPQTGGKGEVRMFDVNQGFLRTTQPLGKVTDGAPFVVNDLDGNGSPELIFSHAGRVTITDDQGVVGRSFSVGFPKNNVLSVGVGDVNNDGAKEIVVASENSRTVKIFSQEGVQLREFVGTPERRVRGLRVAVGAVGEDHVARIITTHTGGTFTNDVWIYTNTGKLYSAFQAFGGKEPKGLRIAAGDVTGDDIAEIVASRVGVAPPIVKVYNEIGVPVSSFTAYDNGFKGGVSLAIGTLNTDTPVIITAALKGGGPHVKIFSAEGDLLQELFGFDQSFRGGVIVGFFRQEHNP